MNFDTVTKWVADHPALAGGSIFLGGIGLLWAFGYFGSNSGGSDPNVAAYYAAQSADQISGNQVAITQIEADTAAKIAQTQSTTDITNQSTWASADQAMQVEQDKSSLALAPFATESLAISGLTSVALIPPTVTTETKHSSGFFGIGGGSKTITTVTPDPAALAAASELSSLTNGFLAGH